MAQNMYYHFVGRILLSIHTRKPPSDEEWDAALADLGSFYKQPGNICTLVFTDGGAPSAAQRKRLREALAGRDILIAVISGSIIPRFVNASIALFNKSIRSYAPEEFPQAREYLQITEEEMQKLWEVIAQIRNQMSPDKVIALERALYG